MTNGREPWFSGWRAVISSGIGALALAIAIAAITVNDVDTLVSTTSSTQAPTAVAPTTTQVATTLTVLPKVDALDESSREQKSTATSIVEGTTVDASSTAISLMSLDRTEGSGWWTRSESLSLAGVPYAQSVSADYCRSGNDLYIEYSIGGGYSVFRTVVGMRDETLLGTAAFIEFWVDGVPVWGEQVTTSTSQEIEIDVTGALTLGVRVTGQSDRSCKSNQGPALGAPVVARNSADAAKAVESSIERTAVPSFVYLTDLTSRGGSGWWTRSESLFLAGVPYAQSVSAAYCRSGNDLYIEYSIGGGYSVFRTVVGMRDETLPGTAAFVEFWVDGVPVWGEQVTTSTSQEIEIDVTGALTLGVRVTGQSDRSCKSNQGPALGNPSLSR